MAERRQVRSIRGGAANRSRATRSSERSVRAKGSGSKSNGGARRAGARPAGTRPERTSRTAGTRSGGRSSHAGRKAASSRASRGTAHKARGSSRRGRHVSGGTRRASRPAPYAVKLLKQDHRALLDCMAQFEDALQEEKHSIAERYCKLLSLHTQIEEELLYPAAHEVLGSDSQLIAVAQVEHAVMKDLVSQIEDMEEVDELFEAKMQVVGELMRQHINEEEGEIFPKLERTSLDLDMLGEQLATRKHELAGDEELVVAYEYEEDEEPMARRGARERPSRGGRSTLIHSGRR
jgi:hemerythrin-like domain-containing protein